MILVAAKYASILVGTRFPFQKQVQESLANISVRAFCYWIIFERGFKRSFRSGILIDRVKKSSTLTLLTFGLFAAMWEIIRCECQTRSIVFKRKHPCISNKTSSYREASYSYLIFRDHRTSYETHSESFKLDKLKNKMFVTSRLSLAYQTKKETVYVIIGIHYECVQFFMFVADYECFA